MQSKLHILPFSGSRLMPSELPSRRLNIGPKTVSSRSIIVSFLIPYINALPPRKIVPQNKKIHFSLFFRAGLVHPKPCAAYPRIPIFEQHQLIFLSYQTLCGIFLVNDTPVIVCRQKDAKSISIKGHLVYSIAIHYISEMFANSFYMY